MKSTLVPSQPMLDALALLDPVCARKILGAFRVSGPSTKAEIITWFENGAPAKILAMSRAANLN